MKRGFFCWVVVFCCVFLSDSAARAANGAFYFGLHGGGVILRDLEENLTSEIEMKEGYGLGAVAGYTLKNFDRANLRFEGEVTFRKNDTDRARDWPTAGADSKIDGDVSSLAVMFNVAVDFINQTPFTPYIMGGLGGARVSFNDFEIDGLGLILDDHDTVLAYQLGAGCAFTLTNHLFLDLGYRFFATRDADVTAADGTSGGINYRSHNVMLGLRFSF
ncbi:MAG: porin family protein [Deltaproteobacteria bacterium]|nr:porin family protein [Deltaproteobacteria bacterium]